MWKMAWGLFLMVLLCQEQQQRKERGEGWSKGKLKRIKEVRKGGQMTEYPLVCCYSKCGWWTSGGS